MNRYFTLVFTLFATTPTLAAEVRWIFRPPPEYDKPFDGVVMVERLSPENMKKVCPPRAIACAISPARTGISTACFVIMSLLVVSKLSA